MTLDPLIFDVLKERMSFTPDTADTMPSYWYPRRCPNVSPPTRICRDRFFPVSAAFLSFSKLQRAFCNPAEIQTKSKQRLPTPLFQSDLRSLWRPRPARRGFSRSRMFPLSSSTANACIRREAEKITPDPFVSSSNKDSRPLCFSS